MPTIQQVTNKATKSHVDAFDGLLRELKNSNRNLHFIIFLRILVIEENHVRKIIDLNQSIKTHIIAIRSVRTIKISIEV